jgi:hypothetical protein
VEAYPMQNQCAETVAGILVREWIARYGCPQFLHSDQGANFESDIMKSVCSLLKIEKTRTVPRHPESDGMVERWNQTVQQILSKISDDKPFDWDLYVPFALMAYRSSKHESTGQTPNVMLFGRENVLPLQAFTETSDFHEYSVPEYLLKIHKQLQVAHEEAFFHLQKASEYHKRGYLNKVRPHEYKIKDLVWYWLPICKRGETPKLSSFWDGPYVVIHVCSDVLYCIQKSSKHHSRIVHHNQLKPCYLREEFDTNWVDKACENFLSNNKKSVPVAEEDKDQGKKRIQPSRNAKQVDRYGDWYYDV